MLCIDMGQTTDHANKTTFTDESSVSGTVMNKATNEPMTPEELWAFRDEYESVKDHIKADEFMATKTYVEKDNA